MQFHSHLYQCCFYEERRNEIQHALLIASPILQQAKDWIRLDHPLAGITAISQDGERLRFHDPQAEKPIVSPWNRVNFPFHVRHADIFRRPPTRSHAALHLEDLLSQLPAMKPTHKELQGAQRLILLTMDPALPVNWQQGEVTGLSRDVLRELREFLTGAPVPLPVLEIPTTPEKKQRWKVA